MEYIYDLLWKEHIKENRHRNYYHEIIRTMSKSDIMEIIFDKKSEIKKLKWRIYIPTQMADLILDEKLIEYNEKLIFKLEFEVRQRDNPDMIKNTKEDLEQKKRDVDIVQLISYCWVKDSDKYKRRNIMCPLPDHKDKTPSFHIYENTNTWRCFGCWKWWTQIDFLMEYYKIPLKEAIDRFLKF